MTVLKHISSLEANKKTVGSAAGKTRAFRSLAALAVLATLVLGLTSCGQNAKTVTPSSANLVHSYFSGPIGPQVGGYTDSQVTIDNSANRISVMNASTNSVFLAVTGTLTNSPTGFEIITENYQADTCPGCVPEGGLTGAWTVEIPGGGALGNLLSQNNTGSSYLPAAAVAMVENDTCPDFPTPVPFLFVDVGSHYGIANINTQGSQVNLAIQWYPVGKVPPPAPVALATTGACSDTLFGPLTAAPLNSFGSSNTNLGVTLGIGTSGLLATEGNGGSFFGSGGGVLGVAMPSSQVDTAAVAGAHYVGLIYNPSATQGIGGIGQTYDITTLASAFGNDSAGSSACSALQTAIAQSIKQGTIPQAPSANSIFGGDFPQSNPGAANAAENCDVAVDLGQQDLNNNGLYPNAQVFIGPGYPKSNTANAYPADAIVGQVKGRYVIFVNAAGTGIYLFQRLQ